MHAKSLNLSYIASLSEIDEIRQLLADCGLPVSDISPSQAIHFFGIHCGTSLVAIVGLEPFGTVGLLRSLAVSPNYRDLGLAHQLVAYVEHVAVSEKIDSLYLLTTTASEFFKKLEYAPASRENAPPSIQTTTQFSGVCPLSSAFLFKSLADSE